jgi:hypothetical protein
VDGVILHEVVFLQNKQPWAAMRWENRFTAKASFAALGTGSATRRNYNLRAKNIEREAVGRVDVPAKTTINEALTSSEFPWTVRFLRCQKAAEGIPLPD